MATTLLDFTSEEMTRLTDLGFNEERLNQFKRSAAILKLNSNIFGVVSLDTETEEEAEYVLEKIFTSLKEAITSFTEILAKRHIPFSIEQQKTVSNYGIDTRRINSFDTYKVSIFKFSEDEFAVMRKLNDGNISCLKICESVEYACKQMWQSMSKAQYNPFEPMEKTEVLYDVEPFTEFEKECILDAISRYRMHFDEEDYAFNYIVPGKICMLKLKSGKFLIAESYFDGVKVVLNKKRKYSEYDRALLELTRRVAKYSNQLNLFDQYVLNNYSDVLHIAGPVTYLHISLVAAFAAVLVFVLRHKIENVYVVMGIQSILAFFATLFGGIGLKKEWQTLRAWDSVALHILTIIIPIVLFVISLLSRHI